MKRIVKNALHGMYLSLYVSPAVFLIETVFILSLSGSFVRYSLPFALTLARYLVYGFVIGAVCSLVMSWAYPYLKVKYTGLFTLSSIVFGFVFLETALFLYDLVYPFGSLDNRQRLILSLMLLALALLSAVLFFIIARIVFPRFSEGLSEISRSRALKLLLVNVLAVLMLATVFFHVEKWLETRDSRSSWSETTTAGPDVILIVLDTVRAEALSCYGNELDVTPNLDRLAEESIVFTRATSPSAWTPPSHASLFTGLYPSAHGTSGLNTLLDSNFEVLSQIFDNAGYVTLTLYNNPLAGSINGMDRGFRYSVGVETDKKVSYVDSRLYYKYVLEDSGAIRTMQLLEAWVKFSRKINRPFLIFLNLNDAHLPFKPREPYFTEYAHHYNLSREQIHEPVTTWANTEEGVINFRKGLLAIGEVDFRALEAAYLSEVSFMDWWIGRTFDTLRKSGYLDNTLVVVTADHGEAFGEHGKFTHANCLYEQVIGVPLFFWYPGILDPASRSEWVSLVDVMPTVLDVCGIERNPVDYELQGRNLLLKNERIVFSEQTSLDTERKEQFAVMDGNFKMIVFPSGQTELYDVASDPGEAVDLFKVETGRAGVLGDALADWKEQCCDLRPVRSAAQDTEMIQILKELGYIE